MKRINTFHVTFDCVWLQVLTFGSRRASWPCRGNRAVASRRRTSWFRCSSPWAARSTARCSSTKIPRGPNSCQISATEPQVNGFSCFFLSVHEHTWHCSSPRVSSSSSASSLAPPRISWIWRLAAWSDHPCGRQVGCDDMPERRLKQSTLSRICSSPRGRSSLTVAQLFFLHSRESCGACLARLFIVGLWSWLGQGFASCANRASMRFSVVFAARTALDKSKRMNTSWSIFVFSFPPSSSHCLQIGRTHISQTWRN